MWSMDTSGNGEQYTLDDTSGAPLSYGSANLASPGSPMGGPHLHHHGSMSPIPQVLSRAGRNTSRAHHNLLQMQDSDGPQSSSSPLKSSSGSNILGSSSLSGSNMSNSGHSVLTGSISASNPSLHHSGSHASGSSSSSTSSSTLSSSTGALLSGVSHGARDISDPGVSLLGHSASSTGSGGGSNSISSPKRTAALRNSRGSPQVSRGSGKDSIGSSLGISGSSSSPSVSVGGDMQSHDRREMSGVSAKGGPLGSVTTSNTLSGSKSLLKTSLGSDRSGIGSLSGSALGSTVTGAVPIPNSGGALASSGGRKRNSGHASLLDAETMANTVKEEVLLIGSGSGLGGVGNATVGGSGAGGNEMLSSPPSANDSSAPRSVKRRKLASSASDSTVMHAPGSSGASGGVGLGGSLSRGHSPAPSSSQIHLSSSTSAISASHSPHMHGGPHAPAALGYPQRRGALSSSLSNDHPNSAPESTVNAQDLMQLEMSFNASLQQASASVSNCMRKMMHHGVLTSHFPFLQERFSHASNALYMISEEFEAYAISIEALSGLPPTQSAVGMQSPPQPLHQSPQHSRGSQGGYNANSPSSSMLSNGVSSPSLTQAQGSASLPRSLFLDHSSHPRSLVQQHSLLHQPPTHQSPQHQPQPQIHSGYDLPASMPVKSTGWPSSPYGDLYHHPPPHSYFVPPHLFNSSSTDLTGALNMSPPDSESYSINPLVHSFQAPSGNSAHSHYHSSSYGSQSAPSASPILSGNTNNSGAQSQGSQTSSSAQGSTSSGTSQHSQSQSGGNAATASQRDAQAQQQIPSNAGVSSAPPASQSPAPSASGVQVSQQQTSSTSTQSSSTSSSQHGLHTYDFGGNTSFFPSPPHPSYGAKATSGSSGTLSSGGGSSTAGGNAQGAAGSYFSSSSTSSTTATDSSSSEAFATYVYQHADPSSGMHYSPFGNPFGHGHHMSHGHNDQPAPSPHGINPHQIDDYRHKKQPPSQYYQ